MDEGKNLSLPHLQPTDLFLTYMVRRGDTPIPSPEWDRDEDIE